MDTKIININRYKFTKLLVINTIFYSQMQPDLIIIKLYKSYVSTGKKHNLETGLLRVPDLVLRVTTLTILSSPG